VVFETSVPDEARRVDGRRSAEFRPMRATRAAAESALRSESPWCRRRPVVSDLQRDCSAAT